jgi:hypothetical protein
MAMSICTFSHPPGRLGACREALVARNGSQMITVDVEAGGTTQFDGVGFKMIHHLALRMHSLHIGAAGVDQDLAALRRQGIAFDPAGSDSTVVIFSRIGSDADVS